MSAAVLVNSFVRPHPDLIAGQALAEGDAVAFTILDWDEGEHTLEGVVTRPAPTAEGRVGVKVVAGMQEAVYLVPADALVKQAQEDGR